MGSRLEKGSEAVRKRIEGHTFDNEEGEEYEGSRFGGFSDYFRRKKIKLQNLDAQVRSSYSDKPHIFKGIVAHVNGYTQPSLNDLHRLIVSHGGGFMQYLDGKTTVTHIIAASLTPKKAIEFKRYRIVKPAWVVDSVNAGKLLPWDSYRVLDEGAGQRLLGFDEGKIVSQASSQRRGYRDQTSTSWYTSQVKGVAEDIDDEDGAHFPSTQQPLTQNGYGGTQSRSRAPRFKFNTPVNDRGSMLSSETGDYERQLDDQDDPILPSEDEDEDEEALDDGSLTHQTNQHVGSPPCLDEDFKIGSTESSNFRSDTKQPPSSPGLRHRSEIPGGEFKLNTLKPSPSSVLPSPSKRAKVMTAEAHNALLLADPKMRKSSTANPDFLRQYYSESRLHHLSTWKAELKARLQQMAAEKSSSQIQAQKRKPGTRRYIMHVDFDSFFCAVSLKAAPQYTDKPCAVAHGSGSGSEIASCNYPARAFGVKNGMWIKEALKLCSDIKVLPYDFPAYEEASRGFYECILDVGGLVQSVSIDEALIDVSNLCLPVGGSDGHGIREGSIWREQEKADQIAQDLRDRIKAKTGCTVSIGIGRNILLAKVALRKAKPAGQHHIKVVPSFLNKLGDSTNTDPQPEEELDFIGDLAVQDLPGVAYSIGGKLEDIGVKFVKDIRNMTKDRLITTLGPKTGEKIWDYSRGIDRTEVGEQVVRKSVSAEVNWGIRFISQPEAEEFVQNLCGELHRRLLKQCVKGRQLTVKIMRRSADAPLDPPKHLGHGKCDTFNKSIVLGVATNAPEIMGREAISILRSYGFSPGELRGLGVQMTKLEPLKGLSDITFDNNQKLISFKASTPKFEERQFEDPIEDDESPRKLKTPHIHSSVGRSSDMKPLNVTGTQFILPSQIDPTVLAELPPDIRSRLIVQAKTPAPASRASSPTKSRLQTPDLQDHTSLPSQLDLEVFNALPDELKAEVLAQFPSCATNNSITSRGRGGQSLLPQSPRKNRTINNLKIKPPTPSKRRPGLLARGRGRPPKILDSKSTLTQSNFIARVNNATGPKGNSNAQEELEEISPEILAALPEDIRLEVLAQHRRDRLARRSNLNVATSKRKRPPGEESGIRGPIEKRKITLPPRPSKPTFTVEKISEIGDLRGMIREWYTEFKAEGPHPDDVGALGRYLRRVVLEEKDMAKAAGILKWLDWLISQDDDGGDDGMMMGRKEWTKSAVDVRETVQAAVRERGLGGLEL